MRIIKNLKKGIRMIKGRIIKNDKKNGYLKI